MRLHKFIADAGVTSRRKAEGLILEGRVQVNGVCITQLGTQIDPGCDVVVLDGEPVDLGHVQKVYMVLNKPRSYMTTLSDPEGRPTVMDLVHDCTERIYPVGRLDYLSEGLLILTNDGEIAQQIIHPSSKVTKVYEVKVFGVANEEILKNLRSGIMAKGTFLKPKSVRIIKCLANKTWLEFRLTDGKNREIREICESIGLTVDKLKRVAIGGLSIDGIAPGNYRYMVKRDLIEKIGLSVEKIYWSSKKSVHLKNRAKYKKRKLGETPADDKLFLKFRKEHYFQTLNSRK